MSIENYLEHEAKYKFTEEMGEISGFGGSYEMGCRVMLDAGLQWIDKQAETDLKFSGYENIYGIVIADSEDAKKLHKAMTPDILNEYGVTGAMMQAVTNHILYIKRTSWEEYIKEMTDRK